MSPSFAIRYELSISAASVGSRVSVRRKLPEGGLGDVLGELTDWSDGSLTVRRKDGTSVRIAEADLVAGKVIPARLDASGYEETAAHVARLGRLEWGDGEPVATVTVPGGSLAVFASDAVDLDAAARRKDKRRAELESEIARAEGKLGNERFVAKAPEAVVQAERDKLAGLRQELEELR